MHLMKIPADIYEETYDYMFIYYRINDFTLDFGTSA